MDKVNSKGIFLLWLGTEELLNTYWELQWGIQEAKWISFRKAMMQDTYAYLTKVSTLKQSSVARAELYSTPNNRIWIVNSSPE